MTSNFGAREESYLRLAISKMEELMRSALGGAHNHTVFRVVLMKILILAIRESSAAKGLSTLDVRELEHHLVEMIESVVEQFCSKWEEKLAWEDFVPSVSAALEVADDLHRHAAADNLSRELEKALSSYLPQLREASQKLGSKEDVDVWALRKYLAKISPEDSESFLKLGQTTGGAIRGGYNYYYGPWYLPISDFGNKEGILEYVDAVTADADDDTRLKHIETLLLQRADAPNQSAQLLAVHRIIQQLGGKTNAQGSRTGGATQNTFDLAAAHTSLCKRLRSTLSQTEFVLITRILETILDEKSYAMTQWNIELTLSTVSVLASEAAAHKAMAATHKAYACLCRLVQVIVRRHRLRLEGHFHLLVTTLQSLLRTLICHSFAGRPYGNLWQGGLIKDPSSFKLWPKDAKAFARLLTMICEPTPGSVARSQQSTLDSATDAAKRYAGQHMYLVLMLYIKLQLEQNVPHDVREALEPGVFAILDITTPEGRRIMNDALDGSGRAIMKELYKQYLKFGKWSGI
jgi:nucleolar pre-ribosomal-associated protein 2